MPVLNTQVCESNFHLVEVPHRLIATTSAAANDIRVGRPAGSIGRFYESG